MEFMKRWPRPAYSLCGLAVCGLAVCLSALRPALLLAAPGAAPSGAAEMSALVVRVIDGDTLDVSLDGKTERVRLLGIDTPEMRHDEQPEEPYAREAKTYARRLANGQRVQLLSERGIHDRDKYGRLLRYVVLPDGRCLNVLLVCEGYARLFSRRQHLSRSAELLSCEKEARAEGRGLWSATRDQ